MIEQYVGIDSSSESLRQLFVSPFDTVQIHVLAVVHHIVLQAIRDACLAGLSRKIAMDQIFNVFAGRGLFNFS